MSPEQRRDVIRQFIQEIEKNEVTREILSEWGLCVNNELVRFTARRLGPEVIQFGGDQTYRSNEKPADWSGYAVRNPVLRTVSTLNM